MDAPVGFSFAIPGTPISSTSFDQLPEIPSYTNPVTVVSTKRTSTKSCRKSGSSISSLLAAPLESAWSPRSATRSIGDAMKAPDGRSGRILVRDTWNTDIVDELRPVAGDTVVYKSRYSGFYKTNLHEVLQEKRIKHLIVVGCTTGVCVESTIRDAIDRGRDESS